MEGLIKIGRVISTKIHYFLHYNFLGINIYDVGTAFWDLFVQLWYFLILGIMFTSLISVFWNNESVSRFFQQPRASWISIILTAVAGVISPMPIYVVIPLIAALYKVGVPVPVLFTFIVSSPLMNPVLFSMTAGAFGYEMAFARLFVAVTLGLTAGFVTLILTNRNYLDKFMSSKVGDIADRPAFQRGSVKSFFHIFGFEFYRLTRFAAKYFLIGIIVAALVKVYIPIRWVIDTLGRGSSYSVLAAVAAGIPLYACGGGSIPVMEVLLAMGMNKGAILAFFISGPATKLSTLVALKAAIKKEAYIVYLLICFIGATIFGYIYSVF